MTICVNCTTGISTIICEIIILNIDTSNQYIKRSTFKICLITYEIVIFNDLCSRNINSTTLFSRVIDKFHVFNSNCFFPV